MTRIYVCFWIIGYAAFIDAEHALDPVYARNLGVDVDNLLVCQVSGIIVLYQ